MITPYCSMITKWLALIYRRVWAGGVRPVTAFVTAFVPNDMWRKPLVPGLQRRSSAWLERFICKPTGMRTDCTPQAAMPPGRNDHGFRNGYTPNHSENYNLWSLRS